MKIHSVILRSEFNVKKRIMKVSIQNAVIGILIAAVIILFWQGCNKDKDRERLIAQLSHYRLSEQEFKQKILSDSSVMSQQIQTILTQREAHKLELIELNGEIKKLQSQVKQSQVIKYDSIEVSYVPDNFADTTGLKSKWYAKFKAGDTSKSIIDSLIANSIIVPKAFSKNEKWFNISGKVKKDNIVIDSISIPNKSTVTIGWKRSGFLKLGKTAVVEWQNTNPNIKIVDMSNVIIKKNKTLFQKPFFWTALGIAGGIFIKSKL